MLSKFANDISLGEGANLSERHAASQRDFARSCFSPGAALCASPCWTFWGSYFPISPSCRWYMLEQPESSLAEKDLGVLLPIRLNMSQECVLVTKKASGILGCLRMSDASGLRKVILALHSALCRHSWSSVFSSGVLGTRETWTKPRQSTKGPWRWWWQRGWSISLWIKAEKSEAI